MRLWDLRKMRTSYEFEEVESRHYGVHNFDYRFAVISQTIYPKLNFR
jgi:WD repeat-containing protein 23